MISSNIFKYINFDIKLDNNKCNQKLPHRTFHFSHRLFHISQEAYTGTKLGTKFNVKDKTKKEHHHDLAYSVKCPMKNCLKS